MTSNTAPSGIASANYVDSNQQPFLAFNRNLAIGSAWYGSNPPAWLAYEFPSPIAIDKYQLVNRGDVYDPRSWTFEAWDGSNWIVLHTVSGSAGSYTSPNIGNSTPYIKYRVNISATNGSYAIIVELYLYEYLSTSPATAGGGFILSDGSTLTCTNTSVGITNQVGITCLTVNNSGTSTVNSHVRATDNSSIPCILKSGTGTFNINGNLTGRTSTNNFGRLS